MQTEQPRKAQSRSIGVWCGGKDLGRVCLQTLQPSQVKEDSEWRPLSPQAASHMTRPEADPAGWVPLCWVGLRPGVG